MILPPLKMYPPSEKWFLEKIQISKTVLISVVQFFYLFFGCPMTNFRSSLRKHLIHPPPPPPQKKKQEWSPMFSKPLRKPHYSDFFFLERQMLYVIHWMITIADIIGIVQTQSTLNDGIFHTDAWKLKFVIFS